MAKKLFEKEQQKIALKKRQEEEDARLARQSSLREQQTIQEKRQRELQLSEQEAKRLEIEERQKLERKHRSEQLSEQEARRLHELQKLALERRKREQALSEAEVRRMKQLELGSARGTSPQSRSSSHDGPTMSLPPTGVRQAPQRGNPSSSLPPGRLSGAGRHQNETDYGRSATSSIQSTSSGGDSFQLPSYDDLVGDGQEEEEHVMDENERIALQEAEDERLARQLAQGDGNEERRRREQEDMVCYCQIIIVYSC